MNSSATSPSSGPDNPSNPSGEGLLIVLVIVIVLLAVIAVLLFVVLMYKRNRLRKRKFKPRDAERDGHVNATFDNGDAQVISIHPVPNVAEESPKIPSPVQSPVSKIPQMDPIPLTSLINYVGENKLNGALVDQWSSLPQDLTQPATVALKNENKPKNRYRNIIAYDEHRVVLELIEGDNFSDYVNASYIKGFQNEKAYIASQGPTTNSIVDFWRMIWQEDIHKISMVANVIEEGRMKCLHYWPTLGDEPIEEGDFIISTISETEKDSYTLRKLQLENKEVGTRELYMFHFTEWPDRDVPADASTLIRYIRDIHALKTEGPDTILVHCSAGAGRTGVFMAIDTQLQRATLKGDVDVFNYALEMRKARPWMVQMPIQYIFIHEAILEAIMCKDTLIHKSELSSLIDRFLESQFETGKSLIEQQFETLNSVSVKVTDYFYKMQAGMKDGNIAKNRYPSVIPIDRFRPKLLIGDDENDLKDYICATFLNRYSKVNGLMVTQMPLPSTITDFWQLIHDYKITALVMLNENSVVDETIGQYWPSDSSDTLVTGKFSVSEIVTETTDHYVIRDLSLKVMREDDDAESEQEEPLTVRQFQLTNWSASSRNPSSISGFLDFILMIKSWMEEDPREAHLPLVHCLNGIGRSGVFCSVFNTLEQLEKQDSVNIFNIIKALRRKQPLLVKTQDEYELIYRLVNLFVVRSETEQVSHSSGNKGTTVTPAYENVTIEKDEEGKKSDEEGGGDATNSHESDGEEDTGL
ncbi:Receptor-type tyrosine-protein phosphatase T [Holothuria leucospilota]|uniref:protein-tyrosine-phosphatase n=1 Tax=Holothuria leucospilota TaxID=206669 RepID=A0A9Q1HCE6_HOLLE|nr:Receptor-type tyrosine-protein phosphatase T [Holothuria leucospilota]